MAKQRNRDTYSIKILGHNFLTVFNHYIMRISLEQDFQDTDVFTVKKIDMKNIDECNDGAFSVEFMKSYLLKQQKYATGYLFYADSKPVGYLWIMRKGGVEVQYKIKKVDAFLFDVCVFEEMRGKGYSEKMVAYVCELLKTEGFKEVFLAVRKSNTIAIKTYTALGAKVVKNRFFIRILKKNIPYYSL